MSDPVPAVPEADATGEIALIFADIRDVLGVGVVNLVWRHLATFPRALPVIWRTLRPLYVDGTIGGEAAALRGAVDLPQLPAFPPEAFAAVGLSDRDIGSIRQVLAAYDRTNAMALIALSAMLSLLDGKPKTFGSRPHSVGTAPPDKGRALPLPSLLNLTDVSPAVAELVLMLNRLGARRADVVLASMYRHLAHWPPYLALAWAVIAPLDANGCLARVIADTAAKARAHSARVAVRLPIIPEATFEPGVRVAVREALDRFAGGVIARMVVICSLLCRASSSGP